MKVKYPLGQIDLKGILHVTAVKNLCINSFNGYINFLFLIFLMLRHRKF